MTEKIHEQSPISCKLVRVFSALDPVKMALLESGSEQSLRKSLISYIVRNVLQQNKEIVLKKCLMTFFKGLLNLARLNLPILIKRLCILVSFLVFA